MLFTNLVAFGLRSTVVAMAKSILVLAMLSWHLRAAATQARAASEPEVATDHG